MLKTVGRIFIILLVSVLIAFGVYTIVQRNPTALRPGNQRGNFDARIRNNGSPINQLSPGAGSQPVRFQGRERGFEGGVSIGRGLAGIAGNLILFSIITLIVIGIQKVSTLMGRKQTIRAG